MATVATGCFGQPRIVERRDFDQVDQLDPLHQQLSDAVAAMHHDGLDGVKIDQRHLDFAAIARIDGSRAVDDRKPKPRGQPRTGVNQTDHPVRDGDRNAGSHQGPMPGLQLDLLRAVEIHPGVSVVGAAGQRKLRVKTDDGQTVRHGATDYP